MSGGEDLRNCTPEALVALSRASTTARLLSGVLHEINNALLVVSGTVELLEARRDLPEAAARPLERLRAQSARMAAVIAQVTAFTQATSDVRSGLDLNDIANAAVELRKFAVSRAGLTIQFVSPGGPLLVTANPGALQHALLNLISAAEQALAGTRGNIVVETAPTPEGAAVRVSDNRATRPSMVESMFEPFSRSGPPADTSGLGLFAARQILLDHGGSLSAEERGEGITWVALIPSKRT